MNTNDFDCATLMSPYMVGDILTEALTVKPPYDKDIRKADIAVRLEELQHLYEVYIPTHMTFEIYSKMYFSLQSSLKKKTGRNVILQRNVNSQMLLTGRTTNHSGFGKKQGIIGGNDSFSIIGVSGIGKSAAIERSIQMIGGESIISMVNPYQQVIPILAVQTPFDCSPKGMLLGILQETDKMLQTHYYQNAIQARATQDMLIGSVSQVCLNHIGLLVVDEIQNIIENRNGRNLVGMLTQLINSSGVSLCFVGTPEAASFFEQTPYLARRTIGLYFGPMEYDDEFRHIVKVLLDYCYTARGCSNKEALLSAAHEYSGGIISNVISLIHDAQETAILSGREILDLRSIDDAWKTRMGMLHGSIQRNVVPQGSFHKAVTVPTQIPAQADEGTETAPVSLAILAFQEEDVLIAARGAGLIETEIAL